MSAFVAQTVNPNPLVTSDSFSFAVYPACRPNLSCSDITDCCFLFFSTSNQRNKKQHRPYGRERLFLARWIKPRDCPFMVPIVSPSSSSSFTTRYSLGSAVVLDILFSLSLIPPPRPIFLLFSFSLSPPVFSLVPNAHITGLSPASLSSFSSISHRVKSYFRKGTLNSTILRTGHDENDERWESNKYTLLYTFLHQQPSPWLDFSLSSVPCIEQSIRRLLLISIFYSFLVIERKPELDKLKNSKIIFVVGGPGKLTVDTNSMLHAALPLN